MQYTAKVLKQRSGENVSLRHFTTLEEAKQFIIQYMSRHRKSNYSFFVNVSDCLQETAQYEFNGKVWKILWMR